MITKDSKHVGRKIGRLRELFRMKQETLAAELGVSQQAISKMEQCESVDERALEQVAQVLGISAAAVKNYSDDDLFDYFRNLNGPVIQQEPRGSKNQWCSQCLDKLIESYQENSKLYERLLACEREKSELLSQRK